MRVFRLLLFVFALLFVAAPVAAAQEASPAADDSLLAALGLEDLTLSTDGTDFEFPSEIEAGRYRLVLENSSEQLSADVTIGLLPEGLTVDDVAAMLAEANEGGSVPDELFTVTFVGGAYAWPASTSDSIVTFAPGEYIIDFLAYQEDEESDEQVMVDKSLTVTGELPELSDPDADVEASLVEMAIEMPDSISAGPLVWHLTNNGAFVHHIIIQSYPEPVTREQVQATLDMFFGMEATPMATPADMLNPDQIVFIDQGQVHSPGQSSWYEFELEPGTYIAFCFISGPGDVPPHAVMGMYKIFTVE